MTFSRPFHAIAALGLSTTTLAACSSGNKSDTVAVDTPLSVAGSTAALRTAGWMPKPVTGMPHTASGVTQVGYLELTAPSGLGIDVQFLPDAADAKTELAAAEKTMPGCHGSTIGNALVFSRADGRTVIPPTTLDDLRGLLRA